MPHLMRHLLYLEKSYFFLGKIADVLADSFGIPSQFQQVQLANAVFRPF
jgi:hypothetical protein